VFHGNEGIQIEMEWVNRGVGRAMQDFEITFELRDANESNKSQPSSLPCSRWVEGEKYLVAPRPKFSNVKPGSYTLSFYIRTRSGQKISLPIKGRGDDGAYDLGALEAR